LTDYFLGYDYRSEINKKNFLGTGGKLVTAFAELTKQMWLGRNSVVEPVDFKKQLGTFAPQFVGCHQHDSQELLGFLLDGIHEDLNRVKDRPYIEDRDCDGSNDENDAKKNWKNYLRRNKSLIVDMFQGQVKNTCKCLKCGHINIRFEPLMYLSLPITKACRSVDDCLDLYLKEENLKGADQYYCEKCKGHVDGTKKQDIWMLPPVLIVHLKRFKYNDYGKVGSKNDASISYPVTEWDLKSRVKSSKGVYPKYDLYAVSNHMGGLGGGHYTAHTLNRFDDTWYEFNDRLYQPVEESIHKSLFKTAYVLFYNRSEGDTSMPLNERSPLIRRQSVSRPELWPHSQVDDPREVRNFKRSRRSIGDFMSDSKDSSKQRNYSIPLPSSTNVSPPVVPVLSSIAEGSVKMSSVGQLNGFTGAAKRTPPASSMSNKGDNFDRTKVRRKNNRSSKPTEI
jgi:ubiquitin carboxyl-terminal hydrolase 8